MSEYNEEDHPALELIGIADAYSKARQAVMITAGNLPGSIDKLTRLKRELHEAALAYALAYSKDIDVANPLLGQMDG